MGISILYVEDDEMIREEMGVFLRRFTGEELYLAADGIEGLELYEAKQPELIVTDIIMPRLDGLEMIRRIREVDMEIPILMVTANSDSDFFAESIELQVNGYIPKPIDLDLLDHKIERIIREIELRQSFEFQKNLLQEIAQLQGNMLTVLDGEYRPIFFNRRMQEFLGISGERASGEHTSAETFWRKICGDAAMGEDPQRCRERLFDIASRSVIELRSWTGESRHFAVDMVRVESSGHTLLTLSEVTELMQERREYEYRAYHDTLTGLGNRFKCDRDMLDGLFNAGKEGRPFSLAVIDLDRFKSVNDLYGHLCGDEVLADFARMSEESLESGMSLYRWGGEEFVLLMPDRDLESAVHFCDRLRRTISEGYFSVRKLSLTASFGVVQMRNREETPGQLFERADRALYRAKTTGRNRIQTAE